MWFNNALVFQYTLNESNNFAELLAEESLKPCPPHARFTYGWLAVIAEELIQEVAGSSLICLGKEEKILPKGVIKRLLAERIHLIETKEGRQIKSAEKAQMAEDLEFELLPKAFCVQKRLFAFFDSVTKRLVINSSSPNQAAQLLSLLRKSIPGLHIEPLSFEEKLTSRFSKWLTNPSLLPKNFQLASDCILYSLDDEKKRVNCKGYEQPAEEIVNLLSKGLAAAEISLIWNDRVQFSLNQDFTFKRIKSLDYLIDEFNEIKELEEQHEQQDAALTLLSGEFRALINDLLADLGQNSTKEILELAENLD